MSEHNVTIGLCAPSWWVPDHWVHRVKGFLQRQGCNVFVHPQVFERSSGQTAGSPTKRVKALHELYENDDIDVIMAMRGGYGALQLLHRLNYKRIAKNPKPLLGFSDCTALINAIYAKTGIMGYHGPMGKDFIDYPESAEQDLQHFINVFRQAEEIHLPAKRIITAGEATGTIIGGNMTVFDQLIGTPYMPDDEDIILCLEEVGEKVNELDKKMLHLKHSGLLNRVRALLVGELTHMSDNAMPFDQTPRRIFQKHCPKIPLIMGVPFGHVSYNATFPIGVRASLITTDNGFTFRITD